MCGITGFIDLSGSRSSDGLKEVVQRMNTTLAHRGPDGAGIWVDAEAGAAIGHRRLAIIDVSPSGHQPMVSSDGRFVITYNGEIYNYRELRSQAAALGATFVGSSDTEVILECCVRFGIEKAVRAMEGMFALAIWDRHRRELTLVRDRIGVKPLYWGRFGSLFMFASELKALRTHPNCTARINHDAVAAYMRYLYVPTPLSIYENVFKLEAGTMLTVNAHGQTSRRYWSLLDVIHAGIEDRLPVRDLIPALEDTIGRAVSRQMVSDVPLGAFLSGGIDSSTITALMMKASNRPVKTFSMGFDDRACDEAPYAKRVAAHLQTTHAELYAGPKDALSVIPHLPDIYDEPFADSSGIPTYLLSRLTRQHVTVCLSGDGGDELFAGYPRYLQTARFNRHRTWIPLMARSFIHQRIRSIPAIRWDEIWKWAPKIMRPKRPAATMYRVADELMLSDWMNVYKYHVTYWDTTRDLMLAGREPILAMWDRNIESIPTLLERIQAIDLTTYLPDDILTKVDRASMSTGLETRVPLLDEEVVKVAFRIAPALRIRCGVQKWPLKQVLARHLPSDLIDRPKMGFSIPLGAWLRSNLREWAEELLSDSCLARSEVFSHAPIRAKWHDHCIGEQNNQDLIWPVLMFQSWYSRWMV